MVWLIVTNLAVCLEKAACSATCSSSLHDDQSSVRVTSMKIRKFLPVMISSVPFVLLSYRRGSSLVAASGLEIRGYFTSFLPFAMSSALKDV